jgi:Kef-type K+ transport system membrane component KefB
VLGFFGEHRPIANFFAELGKLLLMFSAGLEIDIALFRRAQARSIIFGLAAIRSWPAICGICSHTIAFNHYPRV